MGDAPASYGYAVHSIPVFAITPSPAHLGPLQGDDDDDVVIQAGAPATGDDNDGNNDDDGVTLGGSGLQGQVLAIGDTVSLSVLPGGSGNGLLNAWIDFNGDGDFLDSGEQIASDVSGTSGTPIILSVAVPSTGFTGNSYARFRYSTAGGDGPSDDVFAGEEAISGEVEDYQIQLLGTISGQVRLDVDQDGDLSDGDSGIGGVTITLRDATTNAVLATTTTDGSGNYSFTGLPVGDYIVEETDPASHVSTADSDGGNDNSIAVTLGSAGVSSGNDFLDTDRGDLTGHLFIDSDGDGVQDPGEPNLPNVDVVITDALGGTHRVTSDANGDWLAPNIVAGNATVDVDESDTDFPANHNTTATGGSDPGSATVVAGVVTDAGDDGYQPDPGTVSGHLFIDTDGDGVQDPGESNLPNVDVVITDALGNTQTVATNANGNWTASVPAGPATANVDENDPDFPVNHTQTAGSDPTTVTVPAGGSADAGIDGYQPDPGTVSGHLFIDTDGDGVQDPGESNLPNVDVVITDALGNTQTVATDANGNWTASVPPGSTTANVDESDPDFPADHTQTAGSDPTTVTAVSGSTVDAGIDGYQPNPGTISGQVRMDADADGDLADGDSGIAGVGITLLDGTGAVVATTVTDASGNYSFSGMAPGDYTVVEADLPGYASTADSEGANDNRVALTLPPAGSSTGNDFLDTRTGAIGDYVWLDEDEDGDGIQDTEENGVAGVTVNIYDAANPTVTVATTSTDGSGRYRFDDLLPGDYIIEFVTPSGYSLTTANAGSGALADSFDSDADAVSGRTGSVTLAAGENDQSVDAGLVLTSSALPARIGDRVWYDDNGNGIQDSGEPGLSGVKVDLYDAAGMTLLASTVTDGSGSYEFAGLAAGGYLLEFTAPSGHVISPADQAGDDSDSDADPATGRTPVVTVAAGDNLAQLDAGMRIPNVQSASIGDRVWLDANNNGVQDPGETGLGGVLVRLYSTGDPTTPLAQASSAVDGSYRFEGLAPGDYIVEFIAPGGHSFSPMGAGSSATDSDADPATGRTTSINVVVGQNVDDIDAGLVRPGAPPQVAIGDLVWLDANHNGAPEAGEGLPGVTVALFEGAGNLVATTVTDANGGYLFSGLPGGDYRVEVDTDTLPPGLAQIADPDPTMDSATDLTGLSANVDNADFGYRGAEADLSLAKAVALSNDVDSSGNISAGDVLTFTLTLSNAGPDGATGVAVQDVVPNGYAGITAISNGGVLTGATVAWSGLSVVANASLSLTYQAVIQPNGSYTNVAQVTASDQFDPDSTPGNDDGDQSEDDETSATITIGPSALIDLSLQKLVSGGPQYAIGDVVTFTIRVSNAGPGDATGVAVIDAVPDGYEGISNISAGGQLSGNSVVWSNLSVPAGGSLDLTFNATVRHGNHQNTAEITAANETDTDSTPGNGAPGEDDIDGIGISLSSPGEPVAIPTLSGWALMLLGLLLAALGFRRTAYR